MTTNRDMRTRWQKVRDNIYAAIIEAKGGVICAGEAMMQANRDADALFGQPRSSKPTGDDSMSAHIRLDVDEYSLEFGGGRFVAHRHGRTWRDLTGDNLILSLMMLIIELQRIIASNRSESEPTGEEWAIAEQRAGEAKMEADDE